jgi:hypothetical protein
MKTETFKRGYEITSELKRLNDDLSIWQEAKKITDLRVEHPTGNNRFAVYEKIDFSELKNQIIEKYKKHISELQTEFSQL